MVELLVLSLDRDDDLGVKTSIRSPVVGREKVLEAATQLALRDPTEADANTLFGSVKLHDDLRAQNVDVEVAALTGDPRVGIDSDRKIAAQVDEVLRRLKPGGVVVVTDGADDEFLLPILQSRVKVDSVHRVTVIQSEALEGAYYQITKALSMPRFALPLGLVFLVFAVLGIIGRSDLAWFSILLILGATFLIQGFGWSEELQRTVKSIETALQEGHFSFLLYLAAMVLAILGTIVGYTDTLDLLPIQKTIIENSTVPASLIYMAQFVNSAMIWYAGATMLILAGRIISRLVDEKAVWRSTSGIFFALAGALLLGAASHYILSLAGVVRETTGVALRGLAFSVAGAVLLIVLGLLVGRLRKKSGESSPLPA